MGVPKVLLRGTRIAITCLALLILTTGLNGIGASTEGGGFTTFIKADFLAGNTTNTRIGGGQQPAASWGTNATTYCGRLGVLSPIKCLTTTPLELEGTCGSFDDFRIVSNKVGLRRLNWLKRGMALNIGLPE